MKTFLLILVVAAVTLALRLIPVYLFSQQGARMPQWLSDLSLLMPGAIVALLVVYSLKDTALALPASWLPALCGVLTAAALQHFKKNTLVSVFAATAVYMMLQRLLMP